jgi:metallophosphoesterase (TIGR03767 family)
MSAPAARGFNQATKLALEHTIVPGDAGEGGYRRLIDGPREEMHVRNDLGGTRPSGRFRSLVCFVQVSDLHVADVQSPARAEFLDRLGDFDSPYLETFGKNRTYRAQEALNHHVTEAMACAIRRLEGGPLTGAPLLFAVSTGDATDNCQANELEDYVALLDGGTAVRADSGDLTRYEGVGAPSSYDVRYWHPDGTPIGEADDFPRSRYGFPTVPGLLDACRAPFVGTGLGLPWYAVNGNHDALIAGTYSVDAAFSQLAVGGEKPVAIDGPVDFDVFLSRGEFGQDLASLLTLPVKTKAVTADPMRRLVDAREWIAAHLRSAGDPKGHGFDEVAVAEGRAYYGFDVDEIRFLALDTVNRAGGWQGSLDEAQFQWLEQELTKGHQSFYATSGKTVVHDGKDRLFVLLSHHAIDDLTNCYEPSGETRYGSAEISALIGRFPNVICWFNGHTHINAVTPITPRVHDRSGAWQVTTASHIDWPQQSRVVEIAIDTATGDLVIGVMTVDHAGLVDPRRGELSDALTLAGWSREIAANAWQARRSSYEPIGRGASSDRNVVLVRSSPYRLARAS